MHRALPKDEGRTRLRALGWAYIKTINSELEVWARGAVELNVTPETDGSGDYSERMIEMIEEAG